MKLVFGLILLSFSLSVLSSEKCRARYDSMRITHQESTSVEDLYFCFGFHHGQDRAWEMDYFRRVAQGRNAEILGFDHLKSDLMMRLLDLPALASRVISEMPDEKMKLLKLYASGANEGFKIGKDAQEFLDKDYAPEAWKPEHTILVLLLQSFDQTRKTFFRDYEEEKAKETWGLDTERLFSVEGIPWQNTILKEGEYPKREIKKTTSIERKAEKFSLWAAFPSVFGEESGSNSWVISKKKSKSGFAILANDPHLDLKTPMFWYWVHMKAPGIDAVGASIPGVPVIVSGTNGKVAWGITNAYINTADAVILKNVSDDYFESFRPVVKVKWGFLTLPFFLKTFEKTKAGLPLLPLELKSKKKVVLAWSGYHVKASDIAPMFEMLNVQNIDEMNNTLKKVGLPAWNFVFADTKGDIGYRLVGNAYRHTEKTPFGITERSLDEIQNPVFLTAEERPHVMRPTREYVYSANNRHWPADALYDGGSAYSFSFRGFRIDELLKGDQDVTSLKYVQCDRQVVDARFFVEKILRYVDSPELKNWDFTSGDDSLATSIYRRMMDIMLEEWKVNEYALFRILDTPVSHKQKEMKSFYKRAIREIKDRKWGDLHRLNFAHLSKNSDWDFSPDIAGIGDNHSVDPGTSKWSNDLKKYEQYSGASMRMIIEMSPRPKIVLSLPGLNRGYTEKTSENPWKSWKECKYESVQY